MYIAIYLIHHLCVLQLEQSPNIQKNLQKLETFYKLNTLPFTEQSSTPKYLKHETIGGLGSTISFVAILLRI